MKSSRRDLNPQPAVYETAALPIELHERMSQRVRVVRRMPSLGVEPRTCGVKARCDASFTMTARRTAITGFRGKWRDPDSNRDAPAPKAGGLPITLPRQTDWRGRGRGRSRLSIKHSVGIEPTISSLEDWRLTISASSANGSGGSRTHGLELMRLTQATVPAPLLHGPGGNRTRNLLLARQAASRSHYGPEKNLA